LVPWHCLFAPLAVCLSVCLAGWQEHVHDLPKGAARWAQEVTGYEMTVCAGIITFINGVHTGALPGKLVRNPLTFTAEQRSNLPEVPAWAIRGVPGTSYVLGLDDGVEAENDLEVYAGSDGVERAQKAMEDAAKKKKEEQAAKL
jgi:hypothetical protein